MVVIPITERTILHAKKFTEDILRTVDIRSDSWDLGVVFEKTIDVRVAINDSLG